MNKYLLGGGIAVLALAVPAIAQIAIHRGEIGKPTTRAEAEAKVREHFNRFDANHDGFVTTEEMTSFGETTRTEAMGKAFDRFDKNHDGSVTREEFEGAHGDGQKIVRIERIERRGDAAPGDAKAPPPPGTPPHVRMMVMDGHGGGLMMFADADKDGRISLKEMTDRTLERFDKADANHDGTLTPEERRAAHQEMRIKFRDRDGADS